LPKYVGLGAQLSKTLRQKEIFLKLDRVRP